ncbi:protein of unknown function [Xenorhabdus nematophila AN6/1]|nr:hypothetical protein XNA1_2730012 [Xenorhabdus nematophila str. Anatoliense]CEF33435.1 hypothetical protein XNW1_4760012 [Xenorhabdus nematophila str. Websteri]CEK22412.1 protein of unknown function [Xenorhabdus nematophila AN6/1]
MENPPGSGLKRKEHVLSSLYANHERVAVSSAGTANTKYSYPAGYPANDFVSVGRNAGSEKCHHRYL